MAKGEKTWFGYGKINGIVENNLPEIKEGIIDISSIWFGSNKRKPTQEQTLRANSIYARNYTFNTDVNMLIQYILRRFNKNQRF